MTTELRLGAGASRITLPVVPFAQRPVPAFLPPTESPALAGFETLDAGTTSGYGEISSVDRNPQTGEVTATATNTGGRRYPWGIERYRESIRHKVTDRAPESASVLGTHQMDLELPGRTVSWEAELSFTSDRANFYYTYRRRLIENGRMLRERAWTDTIPRDFQ
jgi:hypothetical protein